MLKLFSLLVVIALARCDDSSEEDMAQCTKEVMKFTTTRICSEQELSAECLGIEEKVFTPALDICYKELELDPLNLKKTVGTVCTSEETVTEISECFCRAVDKIMSDYDSDIYTTSSSSSSEENSDSGESINYEENEEYEDQPYNASMIHCARYVDEIYRKKLQDERK